MTMTMMMMTIMRMTIRIMLAMTKMAFVNGYGWDRNDTHE